MIVGEADEAAAAAVEQALGRPLARLDHPTLDDLAGRLAGCRAYVGNDSGVSHLAGLCGARTVALFGPTSPTVWRPLGPRVTVLTFDATPNDVVSAAVP
jgi:ADP-heptose:LPS heptosyltransferase